MALTIEKLHPVFGAMVTAPALRGVVEPGIFNELRAALDEYAVLVLRNQRFTDDEQIAFTSRFELALSAGGQRGGNASDVTLDVGSHAEIEGRLISDLLKVSNVDEHNEIVSADDRRRVGKLGNRIWHTDGSSVVPCGRYTMLSGRTIPPVRADTQFADMRAAYDALDEETKRTLEGLHVHHSLVYSRSLLGFSFPKEEADKLKGAVYPMVLTISGGKRKSLYIGAHASKVVEWPIAEGRLLLRELTEHATQPKFVYSHEWHQDDLVMWDNRTTLHRARPFDDRTHRRDMRRTMILDRHGPQPVS